MSLQQFGLRPLQAADATMTGRNALVAVVVCLGISLWSFNAMVSVTILPSTVGAIGGLDLLSWATTAYVTASIMFSAAGDWAKHRFGERTGIVLGAALFAAGALACCLAPTMPVLLAGRIVQGIGTGLAAALSYALVRSALPAPLWPRMFALIAAVWGASALAGPVVGGLLTQALGWRAAFLSLAVPAVLLAAMAMTVLPPETGSGPRRRLPALRLAMLAAGIVGIGLAGNVNGVGAAAAATLAGAAFLAAFVLSDSRHAQPLLPSDLVSLRSAVGLGLLAMVALLVSVMPVTIYGALVLQRLHGASPVLAGVLVSLETIGWTATALAVVRLRDTIASPAMKIGPAVVLCGLAGTGIALASGPLWAAGATIAITGSGFGICWAFITARVLGGARPFEDGRAASAVPTMQSIGVALGAALTGVAGNGLGIETVGSPHALGLVARDVVLGFTVFAAAGTAAAVALAYRPPLTPRRGGRAFRRPT